jgi:hypothetical protein
LKIEFQNFSVDSSLETLLVENQYINEIHQNLQNEIQEKITKFQTLNQQF